jgi:adenylate cyclase
MIEKLWLRLAEGVSAGNSAAITRLKTLQRAISVREEQGEQLSRFLPGGIADKLRREGRKIGETEELEVTVLMSDIRGYSGIAERTDPSALAAQLNRHRAEMNRVIIDHGGTVMQFVGDAVMAVFGAPDPSADHADRAFQSAVDMHQAQSRVNDEWNGVGLDPFGLGIGLSTGTVAAALLGSEERLEYTVVGDIVNLTQRLQQWAEPGETVLSAATWQALTSRPEVDELEPETVKGRVAVVTAFRFPRRQS